MSSKPPITKKSLQNVQNPIAQQLAALQRQKRRRTSPSWQEKAHSFWAAFFARTGIREKTLLDWLEIILLSLSICAIFVSYQQISIMQRQNIIADKQMKNGIYSDYTKIILDLITQKGLLQSKPGDIVQTVASTQTSLTLRQLDDDQKADLVHFIYGLKLIDLQSPIISLDGADFTGASLVGADLRSADLTGVNLTGTDLRRANFTGANLSHANLAGANLSRAILTQAKLSWTNLKGADLTRADLTGASLTEVYWTGAIMPDGSRYP